MNSQLLISRRSKRNQNCFARLIKWIGKVPRLIINYRFFRSLKHARGEAWNKAQNTI